MRIKSHVVCAFSAELSRELEKRGIEFRREENLLNGESYLIFDALDFQDSYILPSNAFVLTSPFYSKNELDGANWLTCRCINTRISLENEERSISCVEVYEDGTKARHRFPSGDPFYVKAAPKHRDTVGFFSTHSLSEYDLFCSERAKQVLTSCFQDIVVSFDMVLSSQNDLPVNDLYYLCIGETIAIDALDLSQAERFRCPVCGKETLAAPMQLAIKTRPTATIMKTPRCFSYGGNLEYSIIIVSQRFRKALIEHKLDRGLIFEPVIEV